jgi:HSP20 family protein
MAYQFYANHPLVELFNSFVDAADQPQSNQTYNQCGPQQCGPHQRGPPHFGGHRHHRSRSGTQQSDKFVPAADIYSTATEYKVYFSLPSVDKETIELTYDPNTKELAVSGTLVRPSEFAALEEEELKNVLIQSERKVGKFERKLKIPKDDGERIRFEEAVAKFDNGVLELTLPKVEKEGPKTIVVE